MPTPLHDERVFEAPAASLFALWTDPAFQRARSHHLGTIACHAARSDEGGVVVMVLDEARDTGFPPHVFESRHTTRWDRATMRGRWQLEQTGGPGRASARGSIRIDAIGERRCRLVLDGELAIKVRFWGRVIERIAGAAMRAERAREARFVAERLR